jgi:hypothetical protein
VIIYTTVYILENTPPHPPRRGEGRGGYRLMSSEGKILKGEEIEGKCQKKRTKRNKENSRYKRKIDVEGTKNK